MNSIYVFIKLAINLKNLSIIGRTYLKDKNASGKLILKCAISSYFNTYF